MENPQYSNLFYEFSQLTLNNQHVLSEILPRVIDFLKHELQNNGACFSD